MTVLAVENKVEISSLLTSPKKRTNQSGSPTEPLRLSEQPFRYSGRNRSIQRLGLVRRNENLRERRAGFERMIIDELGKADFVESLRKGKKLGLKKKKGLYRARTCDSGRKILMGQNPAC